eukprot:15467910-Alexandrium_andersonii.AAC.1
MPQVPYVAISPSPSPNPSLPVDSRSEASVADFVACSLPIATAILVKGITLASAPASSVLTPPKGLGPRAFDRRLAASLQAAVSGEGAPKTAEAATARKATNAIYEKDKTIVDLFGDLEGKALLEAMMETYLVPNSAEGITVPQRGEELATARAQRPHPAASAQQ